MGGKWIRINNNTNNGHPNNIPQINNSCMIMETIIMEVVTYIVSIVIHPSSRKFCSLSERDLWLRVLIRVQRYLAIEISQDIFTSEVFMQCECTLSSLSIHVFYCLPFTNVRLYALNMYLLWICLCFGSATVSRYCANQSSLSRAW